MSPDRQLERMLKVLVDRFGPARTLGEVYATTYALRTHREGKPITLTDVAAQTGISKQNLSRWLKGHLDTAQAVARPHEEDGRMHRIDVVDLEYAIRHLAAVAEIFGCQVDPAWNERLDRVIDFR